MLGVVSQSMSGNLDRVQALESRLSIVESNLVAGRSPQPISAPLATTLGRRKSAPLSDQRGTVSGVALMIPPFIECSMQHPPLRLLNCADTSSETLTPLV